MHEPANYDCPFCKTIAEDKDYLHNPLSEIVYQNEYATALIGNKHWVNNLGSAIVVPNEHYENLYNIPDDVLGEVYKVVKKMAIAIKKAYNADGTSTRQHNEPAGNQKVWHLHVHVFPRYHGDRLYQNHEQTKVLTAEERAAYAKRLREAIASH